MTKSKIPFRPRPLSYAVASVLAMGAAAAVYGIPSPARAQEKPGNDMPVPVCEPGLEKAAESNDVLAMYEIGDGTMISAPALPKAAQDCMKLTAAGYTLSLDGLGLNVVTPISGNAATYFGADRRLNTDTSSPVICESYYNGSAGYMLEARNSNEELLGGSSGMRGINSIAYNPTSRTITPNLMQATFGPWISCVSKNTANSNPDPVTFSGSFESGPDVHLTYLDESGNLLDTNTLFATIDGPDATLTYRVRLTNRGEVAAQNVRVREYLPLEDGALVPTVFPAACQAVGASPACNTDPNSGVWSQNFATLAPGASWEYELTRTVESNQTGAIAETFIAAFVNPDTSNDYKPANNARQLRIQLQDNALPVVDPKAATTAEDTPVAVTFTGTDSDGSIVAWNIASQPSNGTLSGSGNSRTYTPALDFNGVDTFTYRAEDDDGGLSLPATVTITVTPVNDAPRTVGSIPDQQASEGDDDYTINFDASTAFMDPEGAALAYSMSGAPSGVTINPTTGQVSNVLAFDNDSAGSYPVTVTATEAGVGSAQQPFTLTITNVNQGPSFTLSSGNDQTSDEGYSPSFDVSGFFSDPDGDTPVFSTASILPDGITLSAAGVFSGTISQTAAGSYPITVVADDQQGDTANGSFTWTVNAVNVAPHQVGSIADKNVIINQGFGISQGEMLSAFGDVDGDPLTITSVTGLPPGLSYVQGFDIVGSTGTAGQYAVTVTASDGALTEDQMFTIFATSN
ncbi:MAG: Ig-like domain-containing protein [Lysobacteraceae bacterium]